MNRTDHHASTGLRHTLPLCVLLCLLVISVIVLTPGTAAGTDEGRLATCSELREMFDAGQYRMCLQHIGRVMRSGNSGKSDDRYELLLMRGDCLLRLDDPASARLAYVSAAKSPVPEQAREGRAMAFLIQRSTKMTYVPREESRSRRRVSFDLASKEGKVEALRALLKCELRLDEPEIVRAMHADSLVPIRDVLPKLGDLYAIERTATGGDAQLRPILEATGERARALIERELEFHEETVAAIERRANQRVESPAVAYGWWGGNVRRGLHTRDRVELRELIDYLQRVEETAVMGSQLALSFDGDPKPWDPLIARTAKTARRAQDVLDAE